VGIALPGSVDAVGNGSGRIDFGAILKGVEGGPLAQGGLFLGANNGAQNQADK